MRPLFCILIGWTWAGLLAAQQASLTGPVEAYTFDAPTRSLRAVIGFPGAASFGPTLRDSLDFASVAPHQSYALGFQQGQCLLISGLGSPKTSTGVLADVKAKPDGIAWSGDGSVAVLYSRSGNWLQVVSGLPAAPAVLAPFDVSSLGGVIASASADTHGKEIAAGISGSAGGVFLSSDGQNFVNAGSIQNPAALAFSTDDSTVYALDGSAPQVIALSVSDHTIQTISLEGLRNPVGLQALQDSENHELLYVAAGSDHLLRILDASSGQLVSDVSLNFAPTALQEFGNSSYILAGRSQAKNPLWLFANSPPPAAYFVPAVRLHPVKHGVPGTTGGLR